MSTIVRTAGLKPSTLASDREREVVCDTLTSMHAAGRMDADECARRCDVALRAVTVGELRDVLADLPVRLHGEHRPAQAQEQTRSGGIEAARWCETAGLVVMLVLVASAGLSWIAAPLIIALVFQLGFLLIRYATFGYLR